MSTTSKYSRMSLYQVGKSANEAGLIVVGKVRQVRRETLGRGGSRRLLIPSKRAVGESPLLPETQGLSCQHALPHFSERIARSMSRYLLSPTDVVGFQSTLPGSGRGVD